MSNEPCAVIAGPHRPSDVEVSVCESLPTARYNSGLLSLAIERQRGNIQQISPVIIQGDDVVSD
jgi:hypothetical protein